MDKTLRAIAARPWLRWPLWLLYAVTFYQSGLATTILLLERDAFAGGWQWAWVIAFPPLVIGFFTLNRYLGCGGGACSIGRAPAAGNTNPPGH